MKKNYIYYILITCLFLTTSLQAQKYLEMMDSPQTNVYEVINEGNKYFKNRDKGKGSGYKQFQRWIIENEDRFYPTGDRTIFNPSSQYLIKESVRKSKSNFNYASRSASNAIQNNAWNEVGPYVELKTNFSNTRNGNGRVDAIWVDPNNADRIYIGCRGGGLWTTTNGGINWSPKTDDLGITGVNSIAVNPNNVDEMYIATAIAGNYSIGIFKTVNGGNDWTPTSYALGITTDFTRINKLLLDPSNTNTLYAATSQGLIKFTNNFQNQSTILTGDIIDIEFKPGDSSIIYAVNTTDNTLYRGVNGGTAFTPTNAVGVSKPQVAVTPAQPTYVYFVDKGITYKSTNDGLNFTQESNPDANIGQYGGFAVSDTNANLLINGSLDVYRSDDGANTNFTRVTNWIYTQSTGIGGNFVHADIREVEIVNGVIYIGTDGWLARSSDGGFNYDILTFNVGNHEIYEHGMGVSQSDDDTIIIGTQDNGTSVLNDGNWYHWKGGDGGTSMIDPTNKDIMYGSLYNGDFKRNDGGALINQAIDLGDTKPGTLPPLVAHPSISGTIYLGEANGEVWKSINYGGNWTVIGNLGGTDVVDEMAIAPSNPDYIYVSIKNKIFRTPDGGSTWNEITSNLPNLVIKGIAIDYDDPNHISICYTSYNDINKVFETVNGGGIWTNNSNGLPNLPMTDIVYDNTSHNAMYLSCDVGVYYKDDTTSQWQLFGAGLPNVRANDLEIQHASQKLYVATWGRGIWKANLVGEEAIPVADFEANNTTILEGDSVIFTDTSTGIPNTWSWTFSGGSPITSTDQNPTITYNTAGTYEVELSVTNTLGNSTEIKTAYITVLAASPPVANFTSDKTTMGTGGIINFTDTSTNIPDSWSWSFPGGNPSTSTDPNPSITYDSVGTYQVVLTATNSFGNSTETKVGYITITNEIKQAHYYLNNNFTDTSIYGRDALNSGVSFVSDAIKGQVADFNGTGKLNIPEYSGVLSSNERSITAWIKTTTPNKAIVSWGLASTSTKWTFRLETTGVLRLEPGGGNIIGSTNVADGQWHHVAVTFANDGSPNVSDIKLYVDGIEENTTPTSVAINTTADGNVDIGSDQLSRNFVGQMSDVRIYSKSLSSTEVSDIMNDVPSGNPPVADFTADNTSITEGGTINFTDSSTNSPTSWSWSFPGGSPATSTSQNPSVVYNTAGTYDVTLTAINASGQDVNTKTGFITVTSTGSGDLQLHYKFTNTLNDESSYSRNGSTTGTESYVTGYEGTAYSVNSSNTITVNGYKGVSGNGERTVTAWIKTPAVGSRKTIASWGLNSQGQMFNVMVSNGNIRVEAGGSNVQNDDSTVPLLNSDTWRHIAVTYNPTDGDKLSDVKIYIDGVYYANQTDIGDSFNSETTIINTDTTTNDVFIGAAFYNASYYWQGELDEVKIYSRALTASEIANMVGTTSAPVADFTADNTSITEGGIVNFTDSSTNSPTSWSWSFPGGNPSTSTSQNPSVVYNTAGTYNVTLTATNAGGQDVITKTSYITVNVPTPVADFTSDSNSITEGGTINFTDSSTNSPTSWSWTFPGGSPATSTSQNPIVVYNTAGTYDVNLTATNASGQDVITKTSYITVTQIPSCSTIISDDFESGFGNWNDGGNDVARSASNANSGSYSIRLRDNSGSSSAMTTDPLNLSSYSDITFEFSYYTVSMENNEDFFLEISTNGGSSYSTIKSWKRGTDFNNNTRYNESVLITNPFSNNTVFRLRCDASGNNDQVFIDDVVITSCSGSSSAAETQVLSIDETKDPIEFRLYPNPVKDMLRIKLTAGNLETNSLSVSIYSVNGKEVFRKNIEADFYDTYNLNIGNFSRGIYLLKINTNGKSIIKKIIKL